MVKNKRTPLLNELNKLNDKKRIPFHMPGHKRKTGGEALSIVRKRDITEIRGYDDLHNPTGIIRQSMDYLKEIYGSRESWYLVNGSTLGILASIAAVCQEGDKILIARNCHKSVYNAVRILKLKAIYIYPEISEEYDIFLSVDPLKVKTMVENHPDIRAAVITSPSYEGVVSDIKGIKEYLGEIPLIVDEAHGAHLIFSDYFPKSAVECGADLVVQSCHKTLPCLTQTAVLHLCSDAVPISRINDMLAVFETSSPSYVLLSSAEYGIQFMNENVDIVEKYVDNLILFRRKTESLVNIQLFYPQNMYCFDYDCGKLVFVIKDTKDKVNMENAISGKNHPENNINGRWLFDTLLNDYGIEMEMEALSYVVGMTSVMDDSHDFQVLLEALFKIDQQIDSLRGEALDTSLFPDKYSDGMPGEKNDRMPDGISGKKNGGMSDGISGEKNDRMPDGMPGEKQGLMSDQMSVKSLYFSNEKLMESWEALDYKRKKEYVSLEDAVGRVSSSYVMIYPPGVPFLVPGEKISKETVENISYYLYNGYNVKGLKKGSLEVLCEDNL